MDILSSILNSGWNSHHNTKNQQNLTLLTCDSPHYYKRSTRRTKASFDMNSERQFVLVANFLSARYVGVCATGKSWPPIFPYDTKSTARYYWRCSALKYITACRKYLILSEAQIACIKKRPYAAKCEFHKSRHTHQVSLPSYYTTQTDGRHIQIWSGNTHTYINSWLF